MSIKIGNNTLGGSPVVENSTGNSYTKTMSQATITNELDDKADKNLVNTGFITNCITEIPQDINLELNDGTLTLKAGSKVYIPDGFEQDGTTRRFSMLIITEDKTVGTVGSVTGQTFLLYDCSNSTLSISNVPTTESGESLPSDFSGIFYNTTTNIISGYSSGTSNNHNYSLTIGLYTRSSGVPTSIDQVFNGFGYIGSTVFALPGVKGLAAIGINEDGSIKNQEFEIENVLCATRTWTHNTIYPQLIVYRETNGSKDIWYYNRYLVSKSYVDFSSAISHSFWYNPNTNKTFFKGDSSSTEWEEFGPVVPLFDVGNDNNQTAKITYMKNVKNVFKALDYNDGSYIAQCAMPSEKYIDVTPGEVGTNWTFIAPANGFFSVNIRVANAGDGLALNCNNVCFRCPASTTNQLCAGFVPCGKGDTVGCWYNTLATTNPRAEFRFIYAKGEI